MSRTSVIVALLVAVVLGIGAWVALRNPRGESGATERVLDFDPAGVAEITVSTSPRGVEVVRRGDGPGTWELVIGDRAWPLDPSNVRAAIRVLSSIDGEPIDTRPITLEAGTVGIRTESGARYTMDFVEGAVAGKSIVTVHGPNEEEGRLYRVPADLLAAFITTGPRAWREASPLGPLLADASRVRLESGGRLVALSRVQGRWGVTEPLGAPADREAVQGLLMDLGRVRITDFLDGGVGESADTGLKSPTAIVEIEGDRVRLDGGETQRTTERRRLVLGSAADLGAKSLYCRIEDAGSSCIVAVDREALDGLAIDPAAYVAKVAIASPTADVGSIRIGSRLYERDLDRWTVDGTPATSDEARAIVSVLRLLCESRAADVTLTTPEGLGPDVTIEVMGVGGQAIAEVRAALPDGAPAGEIVVITDPIARRYIGEEEAAAFLFEP